MSEPNFDHKSVVFSLNQEKKDIVATIALRIGQSLDLEVILNQTVMEVRQFLKTDRVVIYRFEPDWSGVIVAEAVTNSSQSIFGFKVKDPCFTAQHIEKYQQGRIQALSNVETADLTACYQEVLTSFKVKANLVIPIVANEKVWGLLIAHHCNSPRHWQEQEIELLKQLVIQVSIAVQQAELYEQVQSLNYYLEQKVKQRTAKLQNSVKFETLIRQVTEKVRDSLDEPQILQTVTEQIGTILNVERCKIELYDRDRQTATIAYEYTTETTNCQGSKRKVKDFAELYDWLLQKQSLQFVEKVPELSPINTQATRLVCPIFDDRGTLGNLWLLRPKEEYFESHEIILVEQDRHQTSKTVSAISNSN